MPSSPASFSLRGKIVVQFGGTRPSQPRSRARCSRRTPCWSSHRAAARRWNRSSPYANSVDPETPTLPLHAEMLAGNVDAGSNQLAIFLSLRGQFFLQLSDSLFVRGDSFLQWSVQLFEA